MKYIILSLMLLLTGCSTWNTPVHIPVGFRTASPNIPAKPDLPIYALTKDSKPHEVIKAYVASVKILRGDNDSLRILLNSYVHKDAESK